MNIKEETIRLIDDLKATCQSYGLGNDGNEYKIITQVFLYKFLNDKFGYELKRAKSRYADKIREADKWEDAYIALSDQERQMLMIALPPESLKLQPQHLLSVLWNQSSRGDFDTIFDATMTDIAEQNLDIFCTQTTQNTKIPLFERLTPYVTDSDQRSAFARALVDKLVNFSFERAFAGGYDFLPPYLSILSKITIRPVVANMLNTIRLTLLPLLWRDCSLAMTKTCIILRCMTPRQAPVRS